MLRKNYEQQVQANVTLQRELGAQKASFSEKLSILQSEIERHLTESTSREDLARVR
jgi:hypothetical protein